MGKKRIRLKKKVCGGKGRKTDQPFSVLEFRRKKGPTNRGDLREKEEFRSDSNYLVAP